MDSPVFSTSELPADGTTELLISPLPDDATIEVTFIDAEEGQVQLLSEAVPDNEAKVTFDTVGTYLVVINIDDPVEGKYSFRREVSAV